MHFLGEVDRPCDFYQSSHCGLLLSVLECAPLGIIEMYNAGVPVVATDTGDIAEMLRCGDEQAGILVPLTETGQVPVSQAARAISEMVLNTEQYEKFRENARKKALEYQMAHIASQYLALY